MKFNLRGTTQTHPVSSIKWVGDNITSSGDTLILCEKFDQNIIRIDYDGMVCPDVHFNTNLYGLEINGHPSTTDFKNVKDGDIVRVFRTWHPFYYSGQITCDLCLQQFPDTLFTQYVVAKRKTNFTFPSISVNGGTTICPGDSVKLTSTPGGINFLWNDLSNSSTKVVFRPTTDSYYYSSTNETNGCRRVSNTIFITANPNCGFLIKNHRLCLPRSK